MITYLADELEPAADDDLYKNKNVSLITMSHWACQKCVGARNRSTESPASDTRPGRICLTPVRVIALVRFARRASQSDLLIGKEEYVSGPEITIG